MLMFYSIFKKINYTTIEQNKPKEFIIMGLKDKPKTWKGLKLKNKHTGNVYIVECAIMSHVQLRQKKTQSVLYWDYRNVRNHFEEIKREP